MELNVDISRNRMEMLGIGNGATGMIEVVTEKRIRRPSRKKTGLIDSGDRLVVIRTNPTRRILLGIKATGQYVQESTVGSSDVVGDVLETFQDGSLLMEEVRATVGPKYVFIVRFCKEEGDQKKYLFYDPDVGNGSRVEFRNFLPDVISSDRLDGRCFVKKTLGNYTMFGSVFQDDLWLYYDKQLAGLTMKVRRKIVRFFMVPKQFQFSVEYSESRRRRDVPLYPHKRNINVFSCFGRKKYYINTRYS